MDRLQYGTSYHLESLASITVNLHTPMQGCKRALPRRESEVLDDRQHVEHR